jgi:hypothetical protein
VRKAAVVRGVDGAFSVEGQTFATIDELGRALLDQGCVVREACRWANVFPSRARRVLLFDQVESLVSSYAAAESSGSVPPLSIMTPLLHSRLSGYSYCFLRELHQLFSHSDSIDWAQLLRWTLGLPTNTQFARGERDLIFDAL